MYLKTVPHTLDDLEQEILGSAARVREVSMVRMGRVVGIRMVRLGNGMVEMIEMWAWFKVPISMALWEIGSVLACHYGEADFTGRV